jgi:hypothetical protein
MQNSATVPKAAEQQSDACRDQERLERPLPDRLLAGAGDVQDLMSSLLAVFSGGVAQLLGLVLGCIAYLATQFLKIFGHSYRLFVDSITQGGHVFCFH